MPQGFGLSIQAWLRELGTRLRRPEFFAFLPALVLVAYEISSHNVVLAVAICLPALVLLFRLGGASAKQVPELSDVMSDLDPREKLLRALDTVLADAARSGRTTCCFAIMLDDVESLAQRHGHVATAEIMRRCGERLNSELRPTDIVARLDGGMFAVVLVGARTTELETMLQLAARLQSAVDAPISLDNANVRIVSTIGFCLAVRAPEQTGTALLGAAETAVFEARRTGPGAIRSFSTELETAQSQRRALRAEISGALDSGEIIAFFQPQISTDTGEVTGFETLARWRHPQRGILSPIEFLETLHDAGLSERLSEVMVLQALTALRDWEKAGLRVPAVGVNFSTEELRNPKLVEKLKWELDRFDITPERLTIEILETVVVDSANDRIVRNISELAQMGCGIDLDDFGTGHASIANIRRFAVGRIKIDRSFVRRVDEDREQQLMLAAILSMAERLGLQTLAEGVETAGEHAMLAQLGCGHVQGYGLGRPMGFDETLPWIERHRSKLAQTPKVMQRKA